MNKAEALKVLGFSTNDNPEEKEIKKAFKKKAVKLHPDVNKADDADDQFKKINEAQDVLLNPQPEPRHGRHPMEDFFNTGPRVHFSVPPIQKNIKISFKDSVLGCRHKVKVDKNSRCEDCKCKECDGRGAVNQTINRGNIMFSSTFSCQKCKGEGRNSDNCKTCSGKGLVFKTSEFSIKIPGGVTNGAVMQLRGFGNIESHNGRLYPGDIILVVNVEYDKDMRIQGTNVISNIEVSLLEALKGTTRKVKTILGETSLDIKKNTKHKDVVVIGRHGVERQGDHLFHINVIYPKNTDKLIEALEDK